MGFKAVWHPGSQHANDGVGFRIQPHFLSDDVGIAAEAFLPKPISHDDHVISTRLAFLGEEISPQP